MPYDDNNIFAKILRGEIPCNKVYEDDFALAFHDIHPLAPTHVLVIPKGPYVTLDDMAREASVEFIGGYFRAVAEVTRITGASETGYRFIANNGRDAHQEVMHLHVHVFAAGHLDRCSSAVISQRRERHLLREHR
ncbi:MAG: histidine triad nucleotide-binding protein [Rhodospirillales bacterium]|nr:histidine triad nucleotide-binding protein [Rhodospirillales bacterium]